MCPEANCKWLHYNYRISHNDSVTKNIINQFVCCACNNLNASLKSFFFLVKHCETAQHFREGEEKKTFAVDKPTIQKKATLWTQH